MWPYCALNNNKICWQCVVVIGVDNQPWTVGWDSHSLDVVNSVYNNGWYLPESPSTISQVPQTSPSAIPSSLLSNQAPLPKPVTVMALAKISSRSGGSTSSSTTSTATSSVSQDTGTSSTLATLASSTAGLIYSTESLCVAATFAHSVKRHRRSSAETSSPARKPGQFLLNSTEAVCYLFPFLVQSPVDSLFCVGPDGILMEYHLEPQAARSSPDVPSSPIELDCQLVQQWCLQRWACKCVAWPNVMESCAG